MLNLTFRLVSCKYSKKIKALKSRRYDVIVLTSISVSMTVELEVRSKPLIIELAYGVTSNFRFRHLLTLKLGQGH